MLSRKLLLQTGIAETDIDKIVAFLCSESGSHDYTIHRREAGLLGLPIEKPNDTFYTEIKNLYDDFAIEMLLTERWDILREIGKNRSLSYSNKRSIIESTSGQAYYFQQKVN